MSLLINLEMIDNINLNEEKFISLFSKKFKFSKNLIKYEDNEVFDMHDHNYFKHNENTTIDEIIKAYKYQQNKGLDYLKLISDVRLNKNILKTMKFEEGTILTMLHTNNNKIKINEKVSIKDINLEDLNKIELKHYGKVYGEDFVLRRNSEFINEAKNNKNFTYLGAYINNKIVGTCHIFKYKDCTCLDSLLVDNRYRHKNIASTIIDYVLKNNDNVYLHADNDDSTKEMYKKLGFKQIDKTYEYYIKVEELW